jgi:capsular exopolysaccharide synthesis family protein
MPHQRGPSASGGNGRAPALDVTAMPPEASVPEAQAVPNAVLPPYARMAGPAEAVEAYVPGEDPIERPTGGPVVSPARLLRALRRRWYVALPLAALAAVCLGYVADQYIPSHYTARTQVYVAGNQAILVDAPDGPGNPAANQRRQIALVRSRSVLQAALQRPGVADLEIVRQSGDPVGWLETELKADFKATAEQLQITLTGPDPRELVILLDAIREAYLQEGVNKETTDKRETLGRLQQLVEEDQSKLESAGRAVREKAKEFNQTDAQAVRLQHQNKVTSVSNLQTHLFQLDVQVGGWEQTVRDLKARPPDTAGSGPVRPADLKAATELALAKDPLALTAQADVERLTAEIQGLEKVSARGDRDPRVAAKQQELAQAKERRAARADAVRQEQGRLLAAEADRNLEIRKQEHETRVQELQAQIDRTRGQMRTIRAEINRLSVEILAEARGIVDLDQLAARAAEVNDRIRTTKTRIEALEIELKAPPRAHTLETAVVTHVPNPQKKPRLVAAAVAVGFFGALLGVAYLDSRSGRIDSPDGVERYLGTGVVGFIPRASAGAFAAVARPDAGPPGPAERAVCDAVDACRALLLNSMADGPKVVMVTSPEAREGKTTLAAQLALSLGRAGYRTLLIDGDVRQPGVHTAFGQPVGPGLVDVLRKTLPLQAVFQKTPYPTLLNIPAGQCSPQEAVPLLQHRMKSVIKKCKPYFEVILIDTPPLLHLPDALVIGRHADGTILSLMNDVSTLPAAQATCARLRAINVPVLGAVLNGARVRGPRGY